MLSEALLIAIGIAAESGGSTHSKPACTAATRGLMWPLEANYDGRLAVELSRNGVLEICTQAQRKYRWTVPVVHVSQLRNKPAAEK